MFYALRIENEWFRFLGEGLGRLILYLSEYKRMIGMA